VEPLKKRKRRFYPGMLVRIAKDCRPEGAATGAEAVYEGLFDSKSGRRCKGPRGLGMPRLLLEDGSRIWGCECFWLPLKEARAVEISLGVIVSSKEAREWDQLCADLNAAAWKTQMGETPETSPTTTLTE
jgi:hypothetical protein